MKGQGWFLYCRCSPSLKRTHAGRKLGWFKFWTQGKHLKDIIVSHALCKDCYKFVIVQIYSFWSGVTYDRELKVRCAKYYTSTKLDNYGCAFCMYPGVVNNILP